MKQIEEREKTLRAVYQSQHTPHDATGDSVQRNFTCLGETTSKDLATVPREHVVKGLKQSAH